MAQLRQAKALFDLARARVVLVGMGTIAESEAFRKKLNVPFAIISDPHGALYRAFTLKRMSMLGYISPRLLFKGAAALAKGHGVGLPRGDLQQLPGVFIISTHGQIVHAHYAAHPADQPSPQAVLQYL